MTDAVVSHGHASIKQGSKSFALASRIFDDTMRADASMLYAWCRYCDDVVDGQIMGHGQIFDYRDGQKERLQSLIDQTSAALGGKPTEDPVFTGLARVFRTHEIPHRHAFELLDGFRMDAEERVYETREEILDYCYHVAGVVGVMMAHIMGVRDDATLDRASDLGLAFQLTNIARDVVDDARADRIYVPASLLHDADAPTDAARLARQENWPAAHEAACSLLDMAETYYASAYVGIRELPFRCAWAICAALKVYREIGQTLRSRGPTAWDERVSAPGYRKTWLALSAVGPAISRQSVDETNRSGLYQRPVTD
ncbi:phytoene/squalene synthase family protein [Parvularcula sp. IMCC14364]|uniref:phytoene/squalene synthase family protein n=1 Tax=Parvularcula sp. IMCC14364 TaxID=3067902 RepID=UPI002741024A|nr:phytoene/squalene synthase family protein [Parvularcula sp. IMCC14364]